MKSKVLKRFLFVLGLVLMNSVPQAFASGGGGLHFSIAGAGSYGLMTQDLAPGTFKGAFGYGGGVLLGFGLGARVGFEVGGIYLQRKAEITGTTGFDGSITRKAIHVPVRLQFMLGSRVLLNVGGFYDSYTDPSGTTDYGATGGLRFHFPMGKEFFFMDFAYNQAMKETTDGSVKTKEVLGLLGITF